MLKNIYDDIRMRLENDSEARWVIERRTGCGWSDIIVQPEAEVSASNYKHIMDDVAARLDGMPLSRLYGAREFWGLNFELSEDTLDPRPETELIVELAVRQFPKEQPLRILDLGTGSGCLLTALLHEFPKSTGVGVDLSLGAVGHACVPVLLG